jgi:hypothetical protein
VAIPFPDGSAWELGAEEPAERLVEAVAWAMRLPVRSAERLSVSGGPDDGGRLNERSGADDGCGAGEGGRRVIVNLRGWPVDVRVPAGDRLPPPSGPCWPAAGRAAAALAVRASLHRSLFLLHGALVVRDGDGVMLLGRSGAGKSTLAALAPAPWASWADDLSMVAPADEQPVRAQPWPTWSALIDHAVPPQDGGGHGRPPGVAPSEDLPCAPPDHPARADVHRTAKLRAVLFVEPGTATSIERAGPAEVVTGLLRGAAQATISARVGDRTTDRAGLRAAWLDTACRVARGLPGFHVTVSLDDDPWGSIGRALGPLTP